MNYYVARGGQQYGPYTNETVRSYLAAGSLLPSDNIREESAQTWTTIGQLFPTAAVAPIVPQGYGIAPGANYGISPGGGYSVPSGAGYVMPQGGGYATTGTVIVPPNLHWAIVLLLCITWIFPFIWGMVQAVYARKIDRNSNAVWAYVAWVILSVCTLGVDIAVLSGSAGTGGAQLQAVLGLGTLAAYYIGTFSIRRAMLQYYNTVEPIQLQLSGVMTFFFGILYLQYHMSRIAKWKNTGVLAA